jgi:O-antigen/teichoic acid export membrane protein
MFWRGVLGYLPVNVIQAVAGFGSIVIFTRILSPTDYGAYALAFSIYALVNTVLFTWIEAAMARFYAVETSHRADLFATLYKAFALMALLLPLAAALILAFAPILGALKLAVASGLGSAVVRSLLKLAQERRRAAGEVRGFAVYDIAQTGGGFLVGVALAFGGFGGSAPLLGAGVSSAVCLIWALPSELSQMHGGRFDRARLRSYLAYGVPIALSLLMSLALATTDRFVLAGYMNEATVGAYHAGYSLSNRTLDVLFVWLGMAGGPACIMALERGGHAALLKTAREQAAFMVMIALPAAVGLALTAAPLADIMVGPALRASAARVTPWIAVSGLFSGLTTYYLHTAFTLSRKTRRLIAAMAIPAAANLALTLILIPRFGLDGAMWATTASYALGMVASYTLGRRALALPIPWATLAQSGVATAAMVVVILRLPSSGGIGELALKASVGALTYGGVALALDAGGVRSYGAQLLQDLKLRLVA